MSDQSDELQARREAQAALARAQRDTVVVFSGGLRIAGDEAVIRAQAMANAGLVNWIEGYVLKGDDRVHKGVPDWWPVGGPGAVIAQPPSPVEVDAHLARMEDDRRAAIEADWTAKRGGRPRSA